MLAFHKILRLSIYWYARYEYNYGTNTCHVVAISVLEAFVLITDAMADLILIGTSL